MIWNLTNISAKIERDMATEDEDFISTTELTGYINDAIREAESEIHKLGAEDEYFLAKSTINLVNGTNEYALPTDMYATKIRHLVYVNGTTYYSIKRLRGSKKFEEYYAITTTVTTSDEYKYLLTNNAATGCMIELVPPSYETITNGIRVWYIRNAKELVLAADVCDIPEFITFIIQYCKVKIYEKEVGHPGLAKAMQDLELNRKLMIDSLTDQIPDDDTLMEQDMSHYQESV